MCKKIAYFLHTVRLFFKKTHKMRQKQPIFLCKNRFYYVATADITLENNEVNVWLFCINNVSLQSIRNKTKRLWQ